MNPVLGAAFQRSSLLGILLSAQTFVQSRQGGLSYEASIYAALGILIGTLIVRGLGEGGYDANRANNNNINKGDVPVAAPDVAVVKAG